jgi:hypothetical protein
VARCVKDSGRLIFSPLSRRYATPHHTTPHHTGQEQRSGLSQHAGDAAKASQNVLSRSGSVGADALMQLLKNYCRSLDIKTSISVGIVGYPNVGKSSLINSLKRAKSVGVSSTPGFTKAMQEVQLDRCVHCFFALQCIVCSVYACVCEHVYIRFFSPVLRARTSHPSNPPNARQIEPSNPPHQPPPPPHTHTSGTSSCWTPRASSSTTTTWTACSCATA